MSGAVSYLSWITREQVRANPNHIFIFGDNAQRYGRAGQAAAMRGEPNAIGIATKYSPNRTDSAYFSSNDPKALAIVAADLLRVAEALAQGRVVCVPRDGLGTGLSELPQRAPALADLITSFFRACPGEACPW